MAEVKERRMDDLTKDQLQREVEALEAGERERIPEYEALSKRCLIAERRAKLYKRLLIGLAVAWVLGMYVIAHLVASGAIQAWGGCQ
jgi:hypothetical protein